MSIIYPINFFFLILDYYSVFTWQMIVLYYCNSQLCMKNDLYITENFLNILHADSQNINLSEKKIEQKIQLITLKFRKSIWIKKLFIMKHYVLFGHFVVYIQGLLKGNYQLLKIYKAIYLLYTQLPSLFNQLSNG